MQLEQFCNLTKMQIQKTNTKTGSWYKYFDNQLPVRLCRSRIWGKKEQSSGNLDSGFTEINLYLILHLFLILADVKFNICATKSSCKDVGIFEYTLHHASICVKFDSCFYLDIMTTFEFDKNS